MSTVAVLFARADSVSVVRLRELFAYDPQTGILTRRIGASNGKAGSPAGTPNKSRHMVVSVDGRLQYVHRIAWAMQAGEWPEHEVDHRDGNPTNNRWANLRNVTHAVNLQNRVPASVNRGSVQLARQYHVAASLGMRAAKSAHSTLGTLQDAATRLKSFEG